MSTVAKRLLTFFIGVPVLISLLFITYQNHIGLQIAVIIFSCLGANEFYNMCKTKTEMPPKVLIIFLTAIIPLLTYIFIIFNITINSVSLIFTFCVILVMAYECFTAKEFSKSLDKIGYSGLCIFYCGYCLSFISKMTTFENSLYFLVLFLGLIFLCDSAAWLFGMLFGKGNRGFFKASPNKSIAGFLGGIIADILFAFLAKTFFPEIFVIDLWKMILLALFTALAAIIGDLIESVFKRSCDVKDSGNIIPGRGGALDSIDSFIVAAPVFYIALHFISQI